MFLFSNTSILSSKPGMNNSNNCKVSSYLNAMTLRSVPGHLAPVIGIEYHYLRMYINSLAVHAIYERRLAGETELKNDSSEQGFISEVLDGSRQVLQIIISLDRENVLGYAPAKTYLIMTSAATYLLKVRVKIPKVDRLGHGTRLE